MTQPSIEDRRREIAALEQGPPPKERPPAARNRAERRRIARTYPKGMRKDVVRALKSDVVVPHPSKVPDPPEPPQGVSRTPSGLVVVREGVVQPRRPRRQTR